MTAGGSARLDASSVTPEFDAAREAGDVRTWVYDPWRERPVESRLALVASAALCGLVLAMREHVLLELALCAFAILSLSPAFLRVECRLDDRQASRRTTLGLESRAWADVRRAENVPAGVLLSPSARPHWLDAHRGLVLPMPQAERAALRADIARRIEPHDG